MPVLHAFPLGPIHNDYVNGTLVFGVLDGEVIVPQGPPDPEAYLRKLRRLVPAGTTLRCDPALATEGVRNGYTPAPLEGLPALVRLQVALALATADDVPDTRANVFGLTLSAAHCWRAQPWVRLNGGRPFSMRVTTAAPRYWEACLLFGAPDREGVALYDPPGSSAAVLDAFEAGDLSRVAHVRSISVLFGEGPDWAAREVGRFTGMPRVPRITVLEGGTRGFPTPEDVLTLMATLEALARLGPEAQTCEVDLHTLGVLATLSLEAPRVVRGGASRRGMGS